MILSFKHKGLRRLFLSGDHRQVNPRHSAKLLRILDRLDASVKPQDMNLPGYRLHEMKGSEKGTWSV